MLYHLIKMTSQTIFHSSVGLKFTPEQIINEMIQFMLADDKRKYKITIGTDSKDIGDGEADFVTAIVIHRVGRGGRYFWRRLEKENLHTLRDRIWQEVITSLDLARDFIDLMKNYPASTRDGASQIPEFDFEVHIDVGNNGDTHELIQELVGFVRANNLEPKIKPDSYAATKVADRHV